MGSQFQNTSNPSSWIDPGASNGGNGKWEYFGDSGTFANDVISNPSTECNEELPTSCIGWTNGNSTPGYQPGEGSHISLCKFSLADGTKTNYVSGDIGGHAPIGAKWTSDHTGWFRIDYSGYNARISSLCNPDECGRTTELRLTGPAGTIASRIITGGVEEGSDNAYTNTRYVYLLADENVMLEQLGGDWVGLTMIVTEVDETEVPPPPGWSEFSAKGYSVPVTGVIYDENYLRPVSGMPIGGIDTGCLDIETTGLIGYSTIFNHLEARGGPVNIPLFGFSVGGQTWVLTNGITKVYDNGTHHGTFTQGTPLSFPGCNIIKDTKYWGHYPILDMTFEYNDPQPPVDVSIRAWCPFIPGDTPISNTPGSVFEVEIENTSASPQSGSFVFNFPRFSSHAPQGGRTVPAEPAESVTRQYLNTDIKGVKVEDADRKMSYVLAVMDESTSPRVGGELNVDAAAWSNIESTLPAVAADNGGSALAVDFSLAAGQTKTIRYVFTWYAPDWNGSGNPFEGDGTGTGGRTSDSYILEDGLWGDGSGAHHIATMNHASNPRSNPVSYDFSFAVTTGQPVALYFTKAAGEDFDDFCAGDMTVEILDGPLAGQTWDLKTDWSDSQNPNGQWEYGGAGGGGWDLLDIQQTDWLSNDLRYPDPQPAWSDGPGNVPGWAKCVNDNPYGKDIITDDVFCHGPASARWVSPANCTIRVTGQVWMVRDVTASVAHTFTHMYAARYPDAISVANLLEQRHEELLARIISWQEAIFKDSNTPGWLADSLINILHLITETSVWGQIKAPVSPVFNVSDGLFGMNECPRGCPQIECIPCSFYGNIPLPYFFPDTALSTLRGYKNYQSPSGRPPWVFGGCTIGTPPYDIAAPGEGYQQVLNGPCYVIMADRYWRITGDDAFLNEFWQSIKDCTDWSFNLRPAYGFSQIVAMPTDNAGTEWFEAAEPGWSGYVTHAGGVRMAHCMIVKKMAEYLGDTAYVTKCDDWLNAGWGAMETHLWDDALGFYRNFNEPETGSVSDFLFGYQLDGEWIADWHGVPSVFPKNRVDPVLEKIRNINCALSQSGAVNYANADGSPAQVAGYGPYSYFPPELMMLAMNYMYEGQMQFGIDLLEKCMENIAVTWGYTWDSPNIMRGDQDTGQRTFGADYYQDMMLWAVPAAMHNQSMEGPTQPGGLVYEVIKAGECARPTADLDGNCWVDSDDLVSLCQEWLNPTPSVEIDIFPLGGDGEINFKDFAVLAQQWLDCGLIDQGDCFN